MSKAGEDFLHALGWGNGPEVQVQMPPQPPKISSFNPGLALVSNPVVKTYNLNLVGADQVFVVSGIRDMESYLANYFERLALYGTTNGPNAVPLIPITVITELANTYADNWKVPVPDGLIDKYASALEAAITAKAVS